MGMLKGILKLCVAYLGASLVGTICALATSEPFPHSGNWIFLPLFPVFPYFQFEGLLRGNLKIPDDFIFWGSFVVSFVGLLFLLNWRRQPPSPAAITE
jgi:hypothetical protein